MRRSNDPDLKMALAPASCQATSATANGFVDGEGRGHADVEALRHGQLARRHHLLPYAAGGGFDVAAGRPQARLGLPDLELDEVALQQ